MFPTRPLRFALTAASALWLAGCSAGAPEPATEAAAGSTSAPASAGRLIPASAADLVAAAKAPGARATLVNVWATWCIPCRQEFPELVKLERDYRDRGLRVLYVSADFTDETDQVKAFLAEHGVTADTYLKTGDDMAFIDGLSPEWSGALPATLVYDDGGNLIRFWEGKADYAQFESAVLEAMNQATASRQP
jgi:thiol-disulfide isomerase/thioredoxin